MRAAPTTTSIAALLLKVPTQSMPLQKTPRRAMHTFDSRPLAATRRRNLSAKFSSISTPGDAWRRVQATSDDINGGVYCRNKPRVGKKHLNAYCRSGQYVRKRRVRIYMQKKRNGTKNKTKQEKQHETKQKKQNETKHASSCLHEYTHAFACENPEGMARPLGGNATVRSRRM